MYAVKGNKEVKIVDIQKEEYLADGFTILDDSLKVVATPTNGTITIAEHNKVLAEKDKKIKELEAKLKEISKK